MPIAAVPAMIGISTAASVGSGLLGASAAGRAADAQANAAIQAAQLQKQSADAALAFQKEQWNTQQEQLQPWLKAGTGAINTLAQLMGPGGQLSSVPQFQAPTGVTEQNDPGYQFRLQQGMKALQSSAAARGDLLSGGTMKALNQFGQDYASNEYNNVYNRAVNDYNQKTNAQNTLYNRYAGLAGTGQNAANTLGQLGNQAAGNVGNILLTSGNQQAAGLNNAAYARASGYINGANAWSGALNNLGQIPLLYGMMNGGGGNPYANAYGHVVPGASY